MTRKILTACPPLPNYYVQPPSGAIDITSFGAKPGGQDNMTAFSNAISAALNTQDKAIYIPHGNFYHKGVIYLQGVGVYGEDPELSIITASDPTNAALWDQVGVTIANIQLTCTSAASANGDPIRHLIAVQQSTNFLIQNCRFLAPASINAINIYQSTHGRVIGNYIDGMGNASIYMSDGDATNNIEVAFNTIRNSGDDGICAETHDQYTGYCNLISIHDNDIANNSPYGRGISIVGAQHVTIARNKCSNITFAGILVADEPSFLNKESFDVTIDSNTVNNCGSPSNGHTGFLLSGARPNIWIDTVRLTNNIATNNQVGNFRQEGNVRNVTLSGNSPPF